MPHAHILSSSLIGGGSMNPDKLSLDLNFATDKTLTARKGPTPTFTRGTNATYVGSDRLIKTTAGIHEPRFDHDPVTGICRGLLIEETRTNLLKDSEAVDSASWNAASLRNLTVAANNIASPSGIVNADKLTVGASTTVYQVIQETPTLVSGTTYTVSCYLKASQVTRVAIYTGNSVTLSVSAIFELTGNGTVVQTSFGTASIQPLSNGWYRCIIVGLAGASAITSLRISPVTGTSTNYIGNNVDSFYIWGAQLEAGAFPTSYIPTTTGTAPRSADVCSITSSTLWNTSEGTLFTHSMLPTGGYDCYPANWVNYFGHRRAATNSLLGMIRGGGTFDITLAASGIAAATLKIASSYGGGSQSAVYNNGTVTSQTTAFTLSPTVLNLGANSPTTCINGHLSSVKYYRKKLSNAKLQTITA